MKSDRWLPMCSCVWRVCHLIYTSHPAFSWLFILFEATLHTPRKHSYTRRLIPFPPQDASLFWMTWMDVVLSASQRNGIFFRSTSGIWSQGHISDLSLEFLHFSNLKSLYARKTLTTVCQYSSCLASRWSHVTGSCQWNVDVSDTHRFQGEIWISSMNCSLHPPAG